MAYEAPQTPCCLTADDDAIDEDPEMFSRCDQCPVAAQIEALDGVNREAWHLFRQVVSRFTVESQAVNVVLQRVTADRSLDEFTELLARFEILYDAVCPPREPRESE